MKTAEKREADKAAHEARDHVAEAEKSSDHSSEDEDTDEIPVVPSETAPS
jgi:hypothetical protein